MSKTQADKSVEEMVRDEIYARIAEEIRSRPDKYVVSREKFSMVVEPTYQYDMPGNSDVPGMDYDEEAHGRFLRRLPHEVKVKTYEPKKGMPGVYKVTENTYFNGEKEFGSGRTKEEILTWDMMAKNVEYGRKLCQKNEQEGKFFPKDILLVNDGKSKEAVQKVLENNAKVLTILHEKTPEKENHLTQELSEEEKVQVYFMRRKAERYINKLLEIEEPKVHMDKPFSFITNETGYENSEAQKYADVLVLGKKWDKSPLDKEVTVYTFTPHNPDKGTPDGFSNKGYEVSEDVYRDGKLAFKLGYTGLADVTEKEFKQMAEYEKKLHTAHEQARGKFYPPNTYLPKSKINTLQNACAKVVKKVKGIHRKRTSSEHQR